MSDVIFAAESIGDGVEALKSTPGSIFLIPMLFGWMPRAFTRFPRFVFGCHALYLVATLFCPQSLPLGELDNEGPRRGPELSSI